jgi:HAD superfamily hydrolase (TIGR01509 family)
MRAALFDLGGTLWDDYPAELEYWRICCELLSQAGCPCSLGQFVAASRDLISRFTPSLSRALVWQFSGNDAELSARARHEASERIWELLEDDAQLALLYPIWPGIHGVLEELRTLLRLAVVSMHGSRVRSVLQRMGLADYFDVLALCDERGYHKPDPRIIEYALQQVQVEPKNCLMIGDRIDNDVWPANKLGLTTVWLKVPPYDIQEPRCEMDQPNLTIDRITELPAALRQRGWMQ